MSAKSHALPMITGTFLSTFGAWTITVSDWIRQLLRVQRHRREAAVLANLNSFMLADIGLTRADVRDAFSEPFWADPTELLSARATERRTNRSIREAESGFQRPPLDRPSCLTV